MTTTAKELLSGRTNIDFNLQGPQRVAETRPELIEPFLFRMMLIEFCMHRCSCCCLLDIFGQSNMHVFLGAKIAPRVFGTHLDTQTIRRNARWCLKITT